MGRPDQWVMKSPSGEIRTTGTNPGAVEMTEERRGGRDIEL